MVAAEISLRSHMDYRGHFCNYTVQLVCARSGYAGGYTAGGCEISSQFTPGTQEQSQCQSVLLFRQGPFCPSAATGSTFSSRKRTEAKSTPSAGAPRGATCNFCLSQLPLALVPVVLFEPDMFQEGGCGSGGGGR